MHATRKDKLEKKAFYVVSQKRILPENDALNDVQKKCRN